MPRTMVNHVLVVVPPRKTELLISIPKTNEKTERITTMTTTTMRTMTMILLKNDRNIKRKGKDMKRNLVREQEVVVMITKKRKEERRKVTAERNVDRTTIQMMNH
jgi:hypothetical protein